MTSPSRDPSLLNSLKLFLHALPSPSPQYCLIGALALGAWGQVRATQDIDLLIIMGEKELIGLFRALEPLGFALDTGWSEQNPFLKGQVTRLRHGAYPVDLLLPRDEHDVDALARRRLVTLEDFSVWTCGPEDLILLKLKASRPRDFEDALSVVRHQRDCLDLTYLWQWADRLGLQGELHYVLGQG